MAGITRIEIVLATASDSGAGTDGDVYAGFCGREFYLDSSADDFERGRSKTYILGMGSNILSSDRNDPRKPQLEEADIHSYPVFIRFVGRSRGDDWKLQRASISINEQIFPCYEFIKRDGIWMGTRAANTVFLSRHLDAVGNTKA